jgi:SAM-dependent methyltransferase
MQLNDLDEVVTFYKEMKEQTHEEIYKNFYSNAEHFNEGILKTQFNHCLGFGELAFSWNWYLLVKKMSPSFKFLEIGVYKGRVLSLIQMLSNLLDKEVKLWGITPLSNANDKYSNYDQVDYLKEIQMSFVKSNVSFEHTEIIKGFSQDEDVIVQAKKNGMYDIIFIDGCHDYDVVCLDIQNYSKLLKPGGYLVLDDASLYLPHAYGEFLGHPDVGKAILDELENHTEFVHLYAVGHNRIWRKNE